MRLLFTILLLLFFLPGCTENTNYAPVSEVETIDPIPKNGIYFVRADDTLYSIAWRYGLDYRYLAKINHIEHPYSIGVGQSIYLRKKPSAKKIPSKNIFSPTIKVKKIKPSTKVTYKEREPTESIKRWERPAFGEIIGTFSEWNKGINIAGKKGDPVFATAPGKVVYSGDGLRAYGNLIIIKHNGSYLSAYAHNSQVLVKEGDWVKAHQLIARMGDTRRRRAMLHFEIRKDGKPVNPLSYLARK